MGRCMLLCMVMSARSANSRPPPPPVRPSCYPQPQPPCHPPHPHTSSRVLDPPPGPDSLLQPAGTPGGRRGDAGGTQGGRGGGGGAAAG